MTDRPPRRSIGALSFLGVGFSFLVEVGACGFIGYWVDGKTGSSPWGLAGGVALGMTLAITHLLRSAAHYEAMRKKEKDRVREE